MSVRLDPGTLFANRYQVIRFIAQGGMGTVYEVLHVETNRRRALKVMRAHLFQNDKLRERFSREARVTGTIRSDHIVDVVDAGFDETTRCPFMVMELLDGEDLAQLIQRTGVLPVADVLVYLRQTASALDKMHAAAIVHRDLKPENLFLTRYDDGSPRVKILDFGLARFVADDQNDNGTGFVGTPLYMAPEQMRTHPQITPRVDIFALGMLAFALLVGTPYWHLERQKAGGALPFLALAMVGPRVPAVERAFGYGVRLPDVFNVWFSRATALPPENRFLTATEAVHALEEVFSSPSSVVSQPDTTMPDQPPEGFVPPNVTFSPTPWPAWRLVPADSTGVRQPPQVTPPINTLGRATDRRASVLEVLPSVLTLMGIFSLALCCAVGILLSIELIDETIGPKPRVRFPVHHFIER